MPSGNAIRLRHPATPSGNATDLMGPKRGSWVYVLRPRVKYPVFMVFNASYGKTERDGGLNVRAINLLMEEAGFDLEGRSSAEKRDHLRLYFNEVVDAMHSPPPSPPLPPSPITPSTPPPQRLPKCWMCDLDCDETGDGICGQCQAEMTPPADTSGRLLGESFSEFGCTPPRSD